MAFMVFAFYFVVQSSEKATVWLNKQTNEEFQERHDQFPKYALVKFLKKCFMTKLPNNKKPLRFEVLGVGRILSTSFKFFRSLKPNAKHSPIDK